MYGWMSLTRAFDDTMVAMWKSGRGLGGTFSQRGHEAISVGVGMAMGDHDVVTPMHRDLGTYLVRGMTPERIFGNLLGRTTGPTGGRDANLHGMGDLSLGIIGFISHIPQALPTALGVAMSFRYRQEERVAISFVGDGGTTAGAFHEVLNMAALYEAPIVIVVENNQYAYSTPLSQEMRAVNIVSKAAAHGVDGLRVDGNDVEAVYEAASRGIGLARRGAGPYLIQADTMRMLGHAIHDGAEYVPADLLERWERLDPLAIHRRRLTSNTVTTEAALDHIDQAAKNRVSQAVAHAEAAPWPDPSTLTDGVYA
jgi:pyruvate dehydrogenase E1 component alpha subunit